MREQWIPGALLPNYQERLGTRLGVAVILADENKLSLSLCAENHILTTRLVQTDWLTTSQSHETHKSKGSNTLIPMQRS